MNAREKNLICLLFGVAFLVINIFLFTSFKSAMQKKRSQLDAGAKKLELMEQDLVTWASKADDVEWLANNQPPVGVHGNIGAELAAYTEEGGKTSWCRFIPAPEPATCRHGGSRSLPAVRAPK